MREAERQFLNPSLTAQINPIHDHFEAGARIAPKQNGTARILPQKAQEFLRQRFTRNGLGVPSKKTTGVHANHLHIFRGNIKRGKLFLPRGKGTRVLKRKTRSDRPQGKDNPAEGVNEGMNTHVFVL